MGSFWLVALPSGGHKQDRLNEIKSQFITSNAADINPFVIPDLKVGTLDSLVKLSDDLNKFDQVSEQSCTKLVELMKTLLSGDIKQVQSTLVVGGNRATDDYLRSFSWNAMKYRIDKPIRELVEAIQTEVAQMDSTIKSRTTAYNQIKANLLAIDRKQQGNLAVRSLADVVRKDHFVLDSEYLTTLLVAVPKQMFQTWECCYETLTQLVVPRSSQKIAQDEEFGLFTVTLFQKVVDEYTAKCRELKFTPREYKYNEKELETTKRQRIELQTLEKEHWGQLLRLTKANFSELFACWIHIKAIRIFVESVLRYGLPPDFLAMAIEPANTHSKTDRQIRKILNGYVPQTQSSGTNNKEIEQEFEEMALIVGVEKEFYNYVYMPIHFSVV